MIVLSLVPATNMGGGAMKLVATFDLQLTDEVAIYGMRLLRATNGQHITYAPMSIGGRRSVTFARATAEAITAAALDNYREAVTANEPMRHTS